MTHALYPIEPVDNGNDIVYRVCLPFLHRSMDVESDTDFQARIERDYAIIVRFVMRHIGRYEQELAGDAHLVLSGIKPKYCGQWGWARGFVSYRKESVMAQRAAKILGLLREECLGNLPAWYAEEPPSYNEVSPKKDRKESKPKQLELGSLAGNSQLEGLSERLVLPTPEPAIEYHVPHP